MKSGLFYSLTGTAALLSVASCSQKKEKEDVKKPYNIVYIMTDDHTAQMMSCYDTRFIRTPNLDRIANDGVRFTNSFVTNSLSGPSRACMFTGKFSHKMVLQIIRTVFLTVHSKQCLSCCKKLVIRRRL